MVDQLPFGVNELFWGMIGLIGVGITILFEMRKNRGLFTNIMDSLRDSTQSTVDEKIAVLYQYVQNVPNWQRGGINTNLMVSNIISDINSIARLRTRMSWEQWRELHRVLLILANTMRAAGINTLEIDATIAAL